MARPSSPVPPNATGAHIVPPWHGTPLPPSAPLSLTDAGCATVLYTVVQEEDIERISSATAAARATRAQSYMDTGKEEERNNAQVFVSERSLLVWRLWSKGKEYVDADNNGGGSGGLPTPCCVTGSGWWCLWCPSPPTAERCRGCTPPVAPLSWNTSQRSCWNQ